MIEPPFGPIKAQPKVHSLGPKKTPYESPNNVLSWTETINLLDKRLKSDRPFCYLRFGDVDLFFINDKNYKGTIRHSRNEKLSEELQAAFMFNEDDYLMGCVAGERACYYDNDLVRIVQCYYRNKTYLSALALQELYQKDRPGFVSFMKSNFWNKRVLLVGGPSVTQNAFVKKVLNVSDEITLSDKDAYLVLDSKMDQIKSALPNYDIVIGALGQATRVLGWRLWRDGYRTKFFDIGSTIDALADKKLRFWINKHNKRLLPLYKELF